MKVTVCELNDNEQLFMEEWKNLKNHLSQTRPDLLLLPELPFCKWIAGDKPVNDAAKKQSVEKHERWIPEMEKLNARRIVYSKPVFSEGRFYNTAFVFEKGKGHSRIHSKSFFPEEPYFWEAAWYDRDESKSFEVIEVGGIRIGVLLCTEMWFTEYARQYGKKGIDLLLCPRATGTVSVKQWVRCGQTLAVISGAYCLSSNKTGRVDREFQWGGNGWIAEPTTGRLIGRTSADDKFVTRDIDIDRSRQAKEEYPLYVTE